jgi:hypothetical protein
MPKLPNESDTEYLDWLCVLSGDAIDTLDLEDGEVRFREKKWRLEAQKKEEAERKAREEAVAQKAEQERKAEAERKAVKEWKAEERKKEKNKGAAKPQSVALQASGSGGKAKGKEKAMRKVSDINEDEEDEALAEKKAKQDPVSWLPVGPINANLMVVHTLHQVEYPLRCLGSDGRPIAPCL